MKMIVSILFCFCFFCKANSQNTNPDQHFEIQKIGFTMFTPPGFKLVDSAAYDISPSPNIKVWRQGFIFKGDSASFIISISKSSQKGIDWPNIHKKEAKHFFEQAAAQQQDKRFDSSSSTTTIGLKTFNKFTMTGRTNNIITYNHVQLSAFARGYRVNITYNYKTTGAAEAIETSLASARFTD